jgi:hypothetical protein
MAKKIVQYMASEDKAGKKTVDRVLENSMEPRKWSLVSSSREV